MKDAHGEHERPFLMQAMHKHRMSVFRSDQEWLLS
jgi:hypothetical protein